MWRTNTPVMAVSEVRLRKHVYKCAWCANSVVVWVCVFSRTNRGCILRLVSRQVTKITWFVLDFFYKFHSPFSSKLKTKSDFFLSKCIHVIHFLESLLPYSKKIVVELSRSILLSLSRHEKKWKRLNSQTRSEIKRHRATLRSEYRSKESHFCTFSAFTHTVSHYEMIFAYTEIYSQKRYLSCAKQFADSLAHDWQEEKSLLSARIFSFLS